MPDAPTPPDPAGLRRRLAAARLYVLATAAVARRPLDEAVDAALAGGATIVQVREKTAADADVLRIALRLRRICDRHGALLIVNDRLAVARDAGADGIHLGQEDASVAQARAALGPAPLVGVSTHDSAELAQALADGADCVGVGAVFPSGTKGRAVTVAGPGALAPLVRRAEESGVPAFAIGGITPRNVALVAAAGIRRVAVSAGVLGDDDPRAAAAEIVRALDFDPDGLRP